MMIVTLRKKAQITLPKQIVGDLSLRTKKIKSKLLLLESSINMSIRVIWRYEKIC